MSDGFKGTEFSQDLAFEALTVPQNTRKPVIVLFSDDSTLIFAQRMQAALLAADPECPVLMTWFSDETALSYRQISQLLPEGPDMVVAGKNLVALMQDPDVDAIVTSRVYRAMIARLKSGLRFGLAVRACRGRRHWVGC